MSDCSTAAMKPKAVDQCPYCGELTPFSGQLIDQQRKESKWVLDAESRYNTLEQRYQQLEQLARDMYSFIAINEAIGGMTIRGQRKPTDKIMNLATFREQLESFGVIVDD